MHILAQQIQLALTSLTPRLQPWLTDDLMRGFVQLRSMIVGASETELVKLGVYILHTAWQQAVESCVSHLRGAVDIEAWRKSVMEAQTAKLATLGKLKKLDTGLDMSKLGSLAPSRVWTAHAAAGAAPDTGGSRAPPAAVPQHAGTRVEASQVHSSLPASRGPRGKGLLTTPTTRPRGQTDPTVSAFLSFLRAKFDFPGAATLCWVCQFMGNDGRSLVPHATARRCPLWDEALRRHTQGK